MVVALYARVSTVRQAEKDLSIPDQLRQMRDWCTRNGYSVAAEYVELGRTATDDRRAVFQQMMAEATMDPSPFEAIIVHSQSRFFRDAIDFGLYERQLNKSNVQLLSITQPTASDPAGGMMRRLFSVFDEYQSKENGKHTLRAMNENARQGFFNGSRPPFGFRTVETERPGRRGKKKRIEHNPTEAAIVRRIFGLYLRGDGGLELGQKAIAAYLNARSLSYRGKPWTKTHVYQVLHHTAYRGELVFNKTVHKTKKTKPESEWIIAAVEPIIDAETFAEARQRAAGRAPANVPPRVVNSPTLLTGLLACGACGAGMTLSTGKGGRYRYYTCNSRLNGGAKTCSSKSIPMDKLDQAVLASLVEKAFTPNRVRTILAGLKTRFQSGQSKEQQELASLKRELDAADQALSKLYEGVEKGILELDSTLQARAQGHKAKREAILTEMAGLRRRQDLPLARLSAVKVQQFCQALKNVLLGSNKAFAKRYLRALVSEIRLAGNLVTITGSDVALAAAVAGTRALDQRVPRLAMGWLPDQGSNLGPAD